MIKLSYEQQIAFNSLSIIVGNALYALTVVLFLVPSGLITGGATGIALGINRALGLPVSGVLFVINMTMLTVGWVLLGRRFAITTIASTVLSPLFLALWERVFTGFVLTDDLVLNTIFAGLGVGVSLGITIRAGASTGGMDIPPLVLNKYFHIPVSASMLVFDMLILCLQAAFSPLQQCLYGIVMVIVYTVVLDKVLIFGTTRTEVKIISQHADDIREAIFTQLDRGVTVLHGEGGYSHEPEQVLLSIVSNRQLPKLEKREMKVLPEEKIKPYLMEADKRGLLAAFYLELTTGLRRGEICGLMWQDFDARNGVLQVRRTLHNRKLGVDMLGKTKTRSGERTIVLPRSTAEILRRRKENAITQWIFQDPVRPELPLSPNCAYTHMKAILHKAGLPDIRFHDLRHTFATHAIASGVDAKTLSGILGHTNASFTLDTYTHVTPDMQKAASGIVGGFMEDLLGKELRPWQRNGKAEPAP